MSEHNVLPLAGIISAGIALVSGDFIFVFSFSVTISTWKGLGSSTDGSAVWLSVCLT
jgi:hypothetical protein